MRLNQCLHDIADCVHELPVRGCWRRPGHALAGRRPRRRAPLRCAFLASQLRLDNVNSFFERHPHKSRTRATAPLRHRRVLVQHHLRQEHDALDHRHGNHPRGQLSNPCALRQFEVCDGRRPAHPSLCIPPNAFMPPRFSFRDHGPLSRAATGSQMGPASASCELRWSRHRPGRCPPDSHRPPAGRVTLVGARPGDHPFVCGRSAAPQATRHLESRMRRWQYPLTCNSHLHSRRSVLSPQPHGRLHHPLPQRTAAPYRRTSQHPARTQWLRPRPNGASGSLQRGRPKARNRHLLRPRLVATMAESLLPRGRRRSPTPPPRSFRALPIGPRPVPPRSSSTRDRHRTHPHPKHRVHLLL